MREALPASMLLLLPAGRPRCWWSCLLLGHLSARAELLCAVELICSIRRLRIVSAHDHVPMSQRAAMYCCVCITSLITVFVSI